MSDTPITERKHPCFDSGHAATTARLHLPVAPRCNVQCAFCDRSFDCVNESRPGVTASIITPEEGLERVGLALEKLPNLAVVGIAGPGDPLANPRETLAALRLVRERYPNLSLCLATNGLALPEHVEGLAALGLSHLTVTVNAINPEVGQRLYSWVRFQGRARSGVEAASLIWERQREGIRRAADLGLTVKINTILVPGVNEGEAGAIARECRSLGASYHNLIPLLPVRGTALFGAGEPSAELLERCRAEADPYLTRLSHCKRCRADAAGLLGQDLKLDEPGEPKSLRPCGEPNQASVSRKSTVVAVASREGFFVNQHMGEADRLYVFDVDSAGSFSTRSIRDLPAEGGGDERWSQVAETIADCEYLLVSGIGAPPRRSLETAGIKVQVVEGLISEALAAIAQGRDLAFLKRSPLACGSSCSGQAMRGCGCA
jgi:nitrogen fixation protein NifB